MRSARRPMHFGIFCVVYFYNDGAMRPVPGLPGYYARPVLVGFVGIRAGNIKRKAPINGQFKYLKRYLHRKHFRWSEDGRPSRSIGLSGCEMSNRYKARESPCIAGEEGEDPHARHRLLEVERSKVGLTR